MLLLVPALNLSGMISSRMERRLPEMGIRKAFGATGERRFLTDCMGESFADVLGRHYGADTLFQHGVLC